MSGNTVYNVLVGTIAVICLAWSPCGDMVALAQENHRGNMAVQKKLDEVARRIAIIADGGNTAETKAAIDKALAESVEQLKKTAGGKGAALIPEIVSYEVAAKDEKLAWAAEFILYLTRREVKHCQRSGNCGS